MNNNVCERNLILGLFDCVEMIVCDENEQDCLQNVLPMRFEKISINAYIVYIHRPTIKNASEIVCKSR